MDIITKKVLIPAGLTVKERAKQREKMQATLESTGWVIKEYFDGGFFKPCHFIVEGDSSLSKTKIPAAMKTWHKVAYTLVILGIIFSFFGPDPTKPVKSDKELFSDYYSQLISNTNVADAAFVPFKEQLQKGDIVGATQIALNIKSTMNSKWSDINSMSLPKFKDKILNEKLMKAHESISNAYMYRSSSVTEFISFAESQNLKKIAELKNTAEAAQMHTVNGMSNLFDVATAVGYSFDNK